MFSLSLLDPATIEIDVWQKLEEQNKEFFKAYHARLLVKEQILMFNHLLKQQADTTKIVEAMKNVGHASEFTSLPYYSGFSLPISSSRNGNMFVRPEAANTNAMQNSTAFRTHYMQQYNQGVNEFNPGIDGGESYANATINPLFHNQSKHHNHDVLGRELQQNVIINSIPYLNHGSAQNNHGVSGEESKNNPFANNIAFRKQGTTQANHGSRGEPNANAMISNTSVGKQCIQQPNNGVEWEKSKMDEMMKSTAFGNQRIQHTDHSSRGGESNAGMLIQSAPFVNQHFHRMYNGYSGGELTGDAMMKNKAFGNQGIEQIDIKEQSNDSTVVNRASTGNQGAQHVNVGINYKTLENTSSSLKPHRVLPDVAFNSSYFGNVFVNDSQVDFKPSRLNILDQMPQSASSSSLRDLSQNHGNSSTSCSDNFEDYGRPAFFHSDSNGFFDSDSET